MSRRTRILIGVIAAIVGIALAIVIPLSLSDGGEKRALALDPTTIASPVAIPPTATTLVQPTETPRVVATATATSRPVPTPDHTPELPAWATRTTTDGARPSSRVVAFRNTITALGELFYQAHTAEITFKEFADGIYSAFASDVQKTCAREVFVEQYEAIMREAAGPVIPSSKEDLQRLREDLDRFYTEEVAIGISKDGTRAQVDSEISTFYPAITYPFVWENSAWKLYPDVPLGCE